MTQQQIDNYLKFLCLKSLNDLRRGYNTNLIAKLAMVDQTTSNNIIHYLSSKNLISINSNVGDNISLTSDGVDYLNNQRANKIFKIIRFKNAFFYNRLQKWCMVIYIGTT